MIGLNMLAVGDNMNNFEEMKLKDIIEMDLKNIIKQLIIPNKNQLNYDKESEAWYIDDVEIVDELYYDCYSITHPKEIIGYVEEYIEKNMRIEK